MKFSFLLTMTILLSCTFQRNCWALQEPRESALWANDDSDDFETWPELNEDDLGLPEVDLEYVEAYEKLRFDADDGEPEALD